MQSLGVTIFYTGVYVQLKKLNDFKKNPHGFRVINIIMMNLNKIQIKSHLNSLTDYVIMCIHVQLYDKDPA